MIIPVSGTPNIHQGYHGPWSHKKYLKGGCVVDDSFSIDFKVPYGTPIYAAEDGIIHMYADRGNDFYHGMYEDIGFSTPTNLLLQDIGYMVLIYSHLEKDSVKPRRTEEVFKGQMIARTGESGWLGNVPHMHFSTYIPEPRDGRRTHPVSFEDYAGPLEHDELFPPKTQAAKYPQYSSAYSSVQ